MVFNKEITPHMKAELQNNLSIFLLRKVFFSSHWIEFFKQKGYKFSHISELAIKSVGPDRNKTYGI